MQVRLNSFLKAQGKYVMKRFIIRWSDRQIEDSNINYNKRRIGIA